MNFLKNTLIALSLFTTGFLISCANDDSTNQAGSTLTFNGVTYTIADAFIEDYGSEDPIGSGSDTHFNYVIGVSDFEFTLIEESPTDRYYGGQDGVTIVIYLDIYSPGIGSFQTGTFDYIDGNTATLADIDGNFFFAYGEVELDDDGVAPNGDLDGAEYDITGGSVTITGTAASYTISFNLETSAGNAVGTYTGSFKYLDNTDQ